MSLKLFAPAGFAGFLEGLGQSYTPAADGSITVQPADFTAALKGGFRNFTLQTGRISISSPLPADLVSVVNAATPVANKTALTIAAQPPQARKLQYNIHIGTTTTTAITAGNVLVVGFDQDGNALSENVSLIATTTTAIKSAFAWSSVTSLTPDGTYAAAGSGTGNTFGVGVTNDFGVPTAPGSIGVGLGGEDLVCVKATKISWGGSDATKVAADDVASTTTVDAVARTIAPTTAPASSGAVDFEFTYTWANAT